MMSGMELSAEQKTVLSTKLEEKMGDSNLSVYDMVRSLVPYEIRDPEGSAAFQKVINSLGEKGALYFDVTVNRTISDRTYKIFLRDLDYIYSFSQEQGKLGVGTTSEVTFEKTIEDTRTTLVNIMTGLCGELQYRSNSRKQSSVRSITNKILDAGKKQGFK